MTFWNVQTTSQRTNNKNLNALKGMVTDVFDMSSGLTKIWCYSRTKSILEQNLQPSRADERSYTFGNGYRSLYSDSIKMPIISNRSKINFMCKDANHWLLEGLFGPMGACTRIQSINQEFLWRQTMRSGKTDEMLRGMGWIRRMKLLIGEIWKRSDQLMVWVTCTGNYLCIHVHICIDAQKQASHRYSFFFLL